MALTTLEQRMRFLMAAATNVDWSKISADELQVGIRDGVNLGKEMTTFIKNGCRNSLADVFRVTGEITMPIPALPELSLEELKHLFPTIVSIERQNSPVEAVIMSLGTVLREYEELVLASRELERRLISSNGKYFGYQQLKWLEEHQDEFPEFRDLAGQIYIHGPALLVVKTDDLLYYPYLTAHNNRWVLSWRSLRHDFYEKDRIAMAADAAD